MKQKILLFLVALLTTAAASAYDFEVDGIYYYLKGWTGTEVAVAYCEDPSIYSGDIVIPETITYDETTYTVTSIGERAFSGCASLSSVTLPKEPSAAVPT